MTCNNKSRLHVQKYAEKMKRCIKSQHCEMLQVLHVSADKQCNYWSYDLFSSHTGFYGFHIIIIIRLNFTMEIIPNQPDVCPKTLGQSSNGYDPLGDRYIADIAEQNLRDLYGCVCW
ncbi:hypothetical protein CDAR_525331 [Caerostris darwini]|uniref:Uncharacterized protein n=1 Tax=Caerostris darwini TaxID=1538125 RepID=A0AAV4RNI0_9ARAC|nr:hypothetical protein CDAR_525331 [Caerostris darwini]